MALKCPECDVVAHTRTSAYESATVKRTWYQCQNIDCSCTFTALESVEKIIMKPARTDDAKQLPAPPCKKGAYTQSLWFKQQSVKASADPRLKISNSFFPGHRAGIFYPFSGWPAVQ